MRGRGDGNGVSNMDTDEYGQEYGQDESRPTAASWSGAGNTKQNGGSGGQW